MSHLVILLPDEPVGAGAETRWWAIAEGAVVTSGSDGGWRERLGEDVIVTALTPPGAVRVNLVEGDAAATAQARTAARLEMVEKAIGGADSLHSAVGDRPLPDNRIAIALVDRNRMDSWLAWCERHSVSPRQIVPASSLLPADGGWHEARIGDTVFIGRDGLAFEESPALLEALVGDDFVDTLDGASIEDAIAREAMEPTVDLRQGDYAWRKPWRFDLKRLREFAILLGLIALTALLIQLVQSIRWEAGAGDLDDETARIASDALGRAVTAEEAEAALATGSFGGRARAGDALASLIAQLESGAMVDATNLVWDGTGLLSATLAAPDANAVNDILLALQRDGWTVTAANRPSQDGRQLVDITMRSGA